MCREEGEELADLWDKRDKAAQKAPSKELKDAVKLRKSCCGEPKPFRVITTILLR